MKRTELRQGEAYAYRNARHSTPQRVIVSDQTPYYRIPGSSPTRFETDPPFKGADKLVKIDVVDPPPGRVSMWHLKLGTHYVMARNFVAPWDDHVKAVSAEQARRQRVIDRETLHTSSLTDLLNARGLTYSPNTYGTQLDVRPGQMWAHKADAPSHYVITRAALLKLLDNGGAS